MISYREEVLSPQEILKRYGMFLHGNIFAQQKDRGGTPLAATWNFEDALAQKPVLEVEY